MGIITGIAGSFETWWRKSIVNPIKIWWGAPMTGDVFVDSKKVFSVNYKHKPHWTAKTIAGVIRFVGRYWQWLITTILAVAALVVSLVKLLQ